MEFGAVFEIIFAFFTILGYLCLVSYISETWLMPRNIVYSVTILDDDSFRDAELIFQSLSTSLTKRLGKKVLVVTLEKYAENADFIKLLENYHLDYLIIKK